MTRKVTVERNLIGLEDLLIGEGTEEQNRNGTTVNITKINANNVPLASIVDGSITRYKLANNSVTTPKIADEAVTTPKLADGSVTIDKLASGVLSSVSSSGGSGSSGSSGSSVSSSGLSDSSVTTAKIANEAVTTPKLYHGAVTSSKLADDSVTTDKLVNEAVTTPKIADYAVTTVKLTDYSITERKIADNVINKGYIVEYIKVPSKYSSIYKRLTIDDHKKLFLINTENGSCTFNLPSLTSDDIKIKNNFEVIFKRISPSDEISAKIQPTGNDTINGSSGFESLNEQGASFLCVADIDRANWEVLHFYNQEHERQKFIFMETSRDYTLNGIENNTFYKIILNREGAGRQQFTVPLPNMYDVKHFGMCFINRSESDKEIRFLRGNVNINRENRDQREILKTTSRIFEFFANIPYNSWEIIHRLSFDINSIS